MAIEEIHARYVTLSHRFRAGWVYQQLLQSLRKVFPDVRGSQHSGEFQLVYTALKEVSESLHDAAAEKLQERLDAIDARISDLRSRLAEEDSRVAPERLRQFFQRYQRHDEKILLQLARFYVDLSAEDGWTPDRIDKLDLLLTRIGTYEIDEERDVQMGNRQHLDEVFRSLWKMATARPDGAEVDEARLEHGLREVEAVRNELTTITSLDELNERGLLDRYRRLKHELGQHLVEPALGPLLLAGNLAFKNMIRRVHRREEQRIVMDYQRIFELEEEVPLDGDLEVEVADFRREIEGFEARLQEDDLRLTDLAKIRGRVEALLPRLQGAKGRSTAGPPRPSDAAPRTGSAEAPADPELEDLLSALRSAPSGASPAAALVGPELFPLRLERREVVAFRRLHGDYQRGEHWTAEAEELEHFVLRAAALRVACNRRAEALRDALDESEREASSATGRAARRELRRADRIARLFDHHLHMAVLERRDSDGESLELLRMRFLRDYAGLWLLVRKPELVHGKEPEPGSGGWLDLPD